MVKVARAGWVVLGGSAKGMCEPQGETGFVNNVGIFFWLVDLVFLFFFVCLFSLEGRKLCQVFIVAQACL